jgi:hypothetical protein
MAHRPNSASQALLTAKSSAGKIFATTISFPLKEKKMMPFAFLGMQVKPVCQSATDSGVWDYFLSAKSQTLATWVYTIVTGVVLYLVYRQVASLREAGDLGAFETFSRLWEDEQVRESRRAIYKAFGPAVNSKDEIEREALEEKILGNLPGNEALYKHIDRLIYRNNLVGALWNEGLLSSGFRNKFIGYIYKTVILQWDCLWPYIRSERAKREKHPNSITYAVPFERLKREAEKRLGNEPRPRPTY